MLWPFCTYVLVRDWSEGLVARSIFRSRIVVKYYAKGLVAFVYEHSLVFSGAHMKSILLTDLTFKIAPRLTAFFLGTFLIL